MKMSGQRFRVGRFRRRRRRGRRLLNSLAINCRAIRLNHAPPPPRLKLSQFPAARTFTRAYVRIP